MLFICQWLELLGDAPVEVAKFNAALLPLVVAFRVRCGKYGPVKIVK